MPDINPQDAFPCEPGDNREITRALLLIHDLQYEAGEVDSAEGQKILKRMYTRGAATREVATREE